MPKRIIFISNNIIPRDDTGGGSVVIYRHLMRLKQSGYQVVIVLLWGSSSTGTGFAHDDFELIVMPKKKWDPPLRRKTPFLSALRTKLTLSRLNKTLSLNSDDIMISVLGEVFNLLAYQAKRHFNTPYYLFYHDDVVFNRYKLQLVQSDKQLHQIMRTADHIFSVTDQMNSMLATLGITHSSILYPIPAGYNGAYKLQSNNNNELQLLTAGMVDHIHFSTLIEIGKAAKLTGGQFYCITDQPAKKISEGGFVNVKPRFNTAAGLFDFILKKIDILVVFYSFDEWHEPRTASSFPSKLVEFCHLGLPILIITPKQSALGLWAAKYNWQGFVNTSDVELISLQIEKYKDPDYYESCCKQSLQFANGIFNPDTIHGQFVKYLNLQ